MDVCVCLCGRERERKRERERERKVARVNDWQDEANSRKISGRFSSNLEIKARGRFKVLFQEGESEKSICNNFDKKLTNKEQRQF